MKPILILKTGHTYPDLANKMGDFEDWIKAGLGEENVCAVCPVEGENIPDAKFFSGIIITGSHAMLTQDLPWMKRTCNWLREQPTLTQPVLGICFGHHLLARAYGGTVDYNFRGEELGVAKVQIKSQAARNALLQGFKHSLNVFAAHQQSVLTLPPKTRLLASNRFDPHQAFCIQGRLWGLQFHPEFSSSIMQAYLERKEESANKELMIAKIQECTEAELTGKIILRRFSRLCRRRDII